MFCFFVEKKKKDKVKKLIKMAQRDVT